jgi:5-methyltetrahydrofolate--homocysteine methyltransferase
VETEKFYEAISQGNLDGVKKLTQGALDAGEKAEAILRDGLLPAMERLGAKFKIGEIYIPEVMIAASAMHAGMAVLKPLLSKSSTSRAAKVVVGTVRGDLHDIGKNLVIMLLEGGGFEVVDLGVDVSPDKFVEAIRAHRPQVVGMSALLTTTMLEMKTAVEAIRKSGGGVKTIVGGAPVTDDFAREIGADGYAPDAGSAVDVVKSLLGRS